MVLLDINSNVNITVFKNRHRLLIMNSSLTMIIHQSYIIECFI